MLVWFNKSFSGLFYPTLDYRIPVVCGLMRCGVGARRVRKVMPVLGGFDQSNYETERLWCTAPDGVKVPISLVYRKDLHKRDGSRPLLLDGCACARVRLKAPGIRVVYAIFVVHGKRPAQA